MIDINCTILTILCTTNIYECIITPYLFVYVILYAYRADTKVDEP